MSNTPIKNVAPPARRFKARARVSEAFALAEIGWLTQDLVDDTALACVYKAWPQEDQDRLVRSIAWRRRCLFARIWSLPDRTLARALAAATDEVLDTAWGFNSERDDGDFQAMRAQQRALLGAAQ